IRSFGKVGMCQKGAIRPDSVDLVQPQKLSSGFDVCRRIRVFPGGGASKPHRSKYILVVDRIVQLPRLWLHPFFFSFALSRLWIALSRFILSEAFLLLSCISFSFVKLRIKGCIHLCSFILL